MKQKLKAIYVLTTSLLAGILLFSCSLQEEELHQFNHDKQLITRKKVSNLFKEKRFISSYQKLPKRKFTVVNTFGRTVMEEQYGFTIASEYANEVISDSITSYTLAIKRDAITPTNNIENLVIQVNNYTEVTKAFILKYKSETPITSFSTFTGKAQIIPIVYNNNPYFSAASRVLICWTVIMPCVNPTTETHEAGTASCGGSTSSQFCFVYSEGTGTGTGGDTDTGDVIFNPTTSAETNGGSSASIVTVPNLPELSDSTPCDKIKNGTSSTQYMDSFNNINTLTTLALPFEYGFAQVNDSYVFSQAPVGESVPIPSGAKNYTHTHPNRPKIDENGNTYDGNVKIHAPLDILALLKKCQRNNDDKTDAFGVVISDEGIFALSILQPIDLSSISTTKWKEFVDNYGIKTSEIISNTMLLPNQVAIRKELMQKYLLKELKKLGLENKIGLFEGTVDTSGLAPKINWQRKKLNASGSLTGENC